MFWGPRIRIHVVLCTWYVQVRPVGYRRVEKIFMHMFIRTSAHTRAQRKFLGAVAPSTIVQGVPDSQNFAVDSR